MISSLPKLQKIHADSTAFEKGLLTFERARFDEDYEARIAHAEESQAQLSYPEKDTIRGKCIASFKATLVRFSESNEHQGYMSKARNRIDSTSREIHQLVTAELKRLASKPASKAYYTFIANTLNPPKACQRNHRSQHSESQAQSLMLRHIIWALSNEANNVPFSLDSYRLP